MRSKEGITAGDVSANADCVPCEAVFALQPQNPGIYSALSNPAKAENA